MKKLLLLSASLLSIGGALAQSPFIQKTCYRGAFAPAPAPMWTDSWTEWDPQNKVYPAPTVTVSGNITSNTTWSSGQTVLLSTQCFVKNNSILTIQPGVTILGNKSVTGAGLFITKGSQLIANGTAAQPIVFTSNQAPGQRGLGDWGGVILMGRASNNNPNGINNIEGLPVSIDTEYGGGTSPDDNDNSGSLKYVRIEWGGYIYQPDKEINGLTFGAVGRGTTIDFVQISYSNDDAFEWFGGAVNCSHLVAYRCLDDNFDTDYGFHGNVQFGLGVRDAQIADNPNVSTSEGFESDNDPNGTAAMPVTSAVFSNITDIGPLRGVATATTATGFRRGARIRRNSALKIVNSIFTDHKTRGIFIDGTLSENNAAGTTTNTLLFKNNILANYGQRATESQTAATAFNGTINVWVKASNDTLPFINGTTSNSILINPYNYLSPDYRPFPGSIAISGASFTDAAIAAVTATSSSSVMANIPANACIGSGTNLQPVSFISTATVSPNYCSLLWNVAPGLAISNANDVMPTFTVSTIGTFTASLVVTNENGTTTIPLSITTNTCLDVAVHSAGGSLNNISVYPNPTTASAVLNLQSDKASVLSIRIYDLIGKEVAEPIVNQVLAAGENKFVLPTETLTNGVYFIHLATSESKETVKLIVNK